MPRPLLLLLLALPLAAAPVPTGLKRAKAPPLPGTVWTCENIGSDIGTERVTLEADGTLTFSKNGLAQAKYKDEWAQDGDALTWSVNDGYAKYTLTYQDGKYVGSATNIRGKTWTATLTPVEKK